MWAPVIMLGKGRGYAYLSCASDFLYRSLSHFLHRLVRHLRVLLRCLLPLSSEQLRPLPFQLVHFFLRDLPDDGLSLCLLLFLEPGFELLFALRGGDVLFDEFLLFAIGERGGGEELFGFGGVGVLG